MIQVLIGLKINTAIEPIGIKQKWVSSMTPEQEKFLQEYEAKHGHIFIIDALEDEFGLTKGQACEVFDEYEAKHPNEKAKQQLHEIGKPIADVIDKMIVSVLREEIDEP